MDSWQFNVVDRLPPKEIKPVVWERYVPILDQSNLRAQNIYLPSGEDGLGSCTGNAMTGYLGCAPHAMNSNNLERYDEQFAITLYNVATWLDAFAGHHPPDDTGSSGVGACKAARAMGEIRGWSTAFSTAAVLQALMHGPVLFGIEWHESDFTPDAEGNIAAEGAVVGGHEVVCRGWDGQRFGPCDQSWGLPWGIEGSFYIPVATVWEPKLRPNQADVTVPHV